MMDNNKTLWFYLDPSGTKQGPFSTSDMVAWREAGWFDALALHVAPLDSESFVPMHTLSCLMHPVRDLSLKEDSYPVVEPEPAPEESAAGSSAPQIPSSEPDDGDDLSNVLSALSLNHNSISSLVTEKKCQDLSSGPSVAAGVARAATDVDDIVATSNTSLNTADHSIPTKSLPADVAAKRDLVRGAQSGRAKWQSFQATKGGKQASAAIRPRDAVISNERLDVNGNENDLMEGVARPQPVSFKVNSKSSAKSKKAGFAQASTVASSYPPPVATTPTSTATASCRKRQPRRCVVVLDTSSWIDEADRTLTPPLLLQGLATTQVTVVLPEQVSTLILSKENERTLTITSMFGVA